MACRCIISPFWHASLKDCMQHRRQAFRLMSIACRIPNLSFTFLSQAVDEGSSTDPLPVGIPVISNDPVAIDVTHSPAERIPVVSAYPLSLEGRRSEDDAENEFHESNSMSSEEDTLQMLRELSVQIDQPQCALTVFDEMGILGSHESPSATTYEVYNAPTLRDGRHVYCDFCDCNTGDASSCMGRLMFQQSNIEVGIAEWKFIHSHHPERDPDNKQARYALYRAVVGWLWANPLGSENRVKLPACVEIGICKTFPNPVCNPETCDYSRMCEQNGHYTGFRSASQSRRIRLEAVDTE